MLNIAELYLIMLKYIECWW